MINYASREINCKLVYYGSGLGGKTTNLEHVYGKTKPDTRGKLISLDFKDADVLNLLRILAAEGFAPRDHLELGELLGAIDVERGAKVSGSRFYYLTGVGALLELALVNHAIALACGVAVQPDPGLRERNYGVLEGHRLDELSERFPVEYAQWQARQPHAEIERGETLAAFHARICASVERIARLHPGQRVVVTAHGGVLDCVYRLASGTALEAKRSWDLLNASINCVRYDGHRFALGAWADVTHLVGDGLDEVDRRYA